MSWRTIVQEPDERRVFEALDEPGSTWRAVDAVALQTGLAEARVVEIAQKYEGALTAESETLSVSGAPLIALLDHIAPPPPDLGAALAGDVEAKLSQESERLEVLIKEEVARRLRELGVGLGSTPPAPSMSSGKENTS